MLTVDQIERLSKAWMVWIFGYLLLGMFAVSQGRTFFVAAAADEPLPLWFKAAFLNLPLQMALALAAVVLVKRTKGDPPSVLAQALAVAASLLMAVNLAVAVFFALVR